jgi:hypothetical protein
LDGLLQSGEPNLLAVLSTLVLAQEFEQEQHDHEEVEREDHSALPVMTQCAPRLPPITCPSAIMRRSSREDASSV